MPPIDQLQRPPIVYIDKLLRQGIFTTGLLLEVSETPTRRQYLADQIQADTTDVNEWRDEALLLNLASVGPAQKELLLQAGIVGLQDLLALSLDDFRARVGKAAHILQVDAAVRPPARGLVGAGADAPGGVAREACDDRRVTTAVLAPPLARRVASIGVAIGTALVIVAARAAGPDHARVHASRRSTSHSRRPTWARRRPRPAELSDLTIHELYVGPGTFAFSWTPGGAVQPFYDAAEIQHLQAVHIVLFGFLALAAIGALLLIVGLATVRGAAWFWRAVARGAASMAAFLLVIGVFAAVAFEQAFTLFHEIFFPGGDWSFDPATEHLVQLYPTAVLGADRRRAGGGVGADRRRRVVVRAAARGPPGSRPAAGGAGMTPGAIRIGRIFGIEVRLHPSWIVIFLLVTVQLAIIGAPNGETQLPVALRIVLAAVVAALFFASVLAHELGHALVGRRFGVTVDEILLFVFGALGPPRAGGAQPARRTGHRAGRPGGEPRHRRDLPRPVAAAGVRARRRRGQRPPDRRRHARLLGRRQQPLPGGREPAAGLPPRRGSPDARRRVGRDRRLRAGHPRRLGHRARHGLGRSWEPVSSSPGGFDILVGLWIVLIGWFLGQAAAGGYRRVAVERLVKGLRVADVMLHDYPVVTQNLTLDTLEQQTDLAGSLFYPVVLDGNLTGAVDLASIKRIPRSRRGTTRVADVMKHFEALVTVHELDPLWDAVLRFDASRVEGLPVVDPLDPKHLVGLVTRDSVFRTLRMRRKAQAAGATTE